MPGIPGGPKGRAYPPHFLDSKVVEFGFYPDQVVTITRGLPADINPDRITVVGEYPSHVVFHFLFRQVDEYDHSTHVVEWNYSVDKASLVSGEVVVKDIRDKVIRPKDETAQGKRRNRNDDGYRGPKYDCNQGQEVVITLGLPKSIHPDRTTIVRQNPHEVVFLLEFDQPNGKVRKQQYSISKELLDKGKAEFTTKDGDPIGPAPRRSERRNQGDDKQKDTRPSRNQRRSRWDVLEMSYSDPDSLL